MTASAFIPIPRATIQRLQLDLTADENLISTEHLFAWDPENRLGVLTCLRSAQGEGVRWVRSYFFSVFDQLGDLKRQYDLPQVAALIETEDTLFPRGLEFSSDGYILIGGSNSYSHDNNFLSGLYVVSVEQDRVVQRLPWFASRIVWTHDGFLLGTLHASTEHNPELDDALIISSAPLCGRFEPTKDAAGLGDRRLVAILNPDSPKWHPTAYQGLRPSQPRHALRRGPGFGGIYQTHSVVSLNDGNLLASIWNTARHTILDYYFAIFSRDGDRLHEINDEVEKHAQIANDPDQGLLVYRDTSEMRIYDYQGRRLATMPLKKTSASTLKNYELVSINREGRLLFASPRLKQKNCFFILNGGAAGYANYREIVAAGAKTHKSWLAKKKKELTPTFFRWTC